MSEVTHAEPSKLDASGVSPGHPTATPKTGPKPGGRVWPDVKKVSVCRSWVGKVQRMLSPAWIQSSFGKKASAWLPPLGLSAPAFACHSVARSVAPAIRMAATANEVLCFEIRMTSRCARRVEMARAEGVGKGVLRLHQIEN